MSKVTDGLIDSTDWLFDPAVGNTSWGNSLQIATCQHPTKSRQGLYELYVLYVSDHYIISQFWNGEVFHDQKSGSSIFPTFWWIAVKDTGFEVLSGKKRPKVQPEAGGSNGPTAPFLMQGQYMSMATLMEPQTFLGRWFTQWMKQFVGAIFSLGFCKNTCKRYNILQRYRFVWKLSGKAHWLRKLRSLYLQKLARTWAKIPYFQTRPTIM